MMTKMIRTSSAIALLVLASSLQALEWPKELVDSPDIKLPISVGRTHWDSWGASYTDEDEFTRRAAQVREEIHRLSGNGFFGADTPYWDLWEFPGKKLDIGRLPCRDGLDCYLAIDNPMVFLITVKTGLIVDATLVNADHKEYDDQGKERHTDQLDSTFGDGTVWQRLPITRFEETGIFCTVHVNDRDEGGQFVLPSKRRVSTETSAYDGHIGYEEISRLEDCKAPWNMDYWGRDRRVLSH